MSEGKQSSCPASNVSGKVALVTGSSNGDGIGIGVARSLASRGCAVILTGSRGPETVEQLRSELEKEYGVSFHYFAADFNKLDDVEKLIKDINSIYPSGVDILVNNAVFRCSFPVEDLDVSIWEKSLRINLTVPFYLVQLTLPGMRKKGWGKIINISSVWALGGQPLVADHVASKHGLNGLSKTVALETLGSGVTCNAICPAAVRTGAFLKWLGQCATEKGIPLEEYEKKFLADVNPSGEYVTIEQIGELAAFLCSPAADQMTGTCIPIDGGNRAK